ncbi:MAG: hypothetical protein LBE17_11020 [Treponema sp.]|jgi:hypothetical protein|nr:hypothetical protein [Treponema sp.]
MGAGRRKIAAGFILAALSLLGGCEHIAGPSLFVTTGDGAVLLDGASLLPVPVRREYNLKNDAIAKTEDHLAVFVVHAGGNIRKIALEQTEVFLEQDRITAAPHTFTSSGEKTVTVRYGDREARYAVIVRSDDAGGGASQGTASGDGTSIGWELIW